MSSCERRSLIPATQKFSPERHSRSPTRTARELQSQSGNVEETHSLSIGVLIVLRIKKLLPGVWVGVQGLGIVDIRWVLLDSREPKNNSVFFG